LRVYSSYQLDQFQTCPKLWDLSKRWNPIEENWLVSMHLGAVIAVGLAAARLGHTWQDAMEKELDKRYVRTSERTFEGVMKHALKGVDLGLSAGLGLKSIITADQRKYGRSRPDADMDVMLWRGQGSYKLWQTIEESG
jgi:hypothetical protein